MHGGYGFGSGWASRGSGTAGPTGTAATLARNVKDYDSARDYIGDKTDRPLAYATRLWKVERDGSDPAYSRQGFAVVHHGTPIIVWRKDGLTEVMPYDSVTTKARHRRYAGISISRDNGSLALWPRYQDWDSAPKTPRNIRPCRTCKGIGRRGEHWCDAWYHGSKSYYPCLKDRFETRNGRTERVGHRSHHYGPTTVPCEDCKGLGRRDYGSRVIPFHVEHGSWYLLSNGRVAGHLTDRSGRWNQSRRTAAGKPGKKVSGEITAYRAWAIRSEYGKQDGTLFPLGIGGNGYESFNLPSAECRNGRAHGAPAVGCTCGYWAMKHPSDIPSGPVFGAVRLWGTVMEHEIGYRAERMAIDYLVVPDPQTAAMVAARYRDVPVYCEGSIGTSEPTSDPVTANYPVLTNQE